MPIPYLKEVNLQENELLSINSFLDLIIDQNQLLTGSDVDNLILRIKSIDYDSVIPQRIKDLFDQFKQGESCTHVIWIKGFKFNQHFDEKTPSHWNSRLESRPSKCIIRFELFQILFCHYLGTIFNFPTCQNGQLIHDLIPIKGDENEQYSSSSKVKIEFHTEDAFSDSRARFLHLGGVRNNQRTETLISIPDFSKLSTSEYESLFEKSFYIYPDDSHFLNNVSKTFSSCQTPTSVLCGNDKFPSLRYDDYYTNLNSTNSVQKQSYNKLKKTIEENSKGISLNEGDLFFIDNYKVLHGRSHFSASYDGSDRWIKRIFIK